MTMRNPVHRGAPPEVYSRRSLHPAEGGRYEA